ncbi:hypothetical protein B0J11DRAFT_486846 [Dendryphion nanum]|uniref:Uncharacterized protein n=1 Tax=Dendryphion nanum TaxID=256645 RepID=A0A9P9DVL5_9PLEO|nr:hypothetical protein B0J11DRAFT_486846 [Dendryphion nanum]
MPSLTPSTISLSAFQKILARYPSTVPTKLQDLDTSRYTTIPDALASRRAAEDAHLEKVEVEKLVEWKLKHGTFRPKLLALVSSNPAALIQTTISDAFNTLESSSSPSTSPSTLLASLKILTQLKGIGPATASLLLSVYAPDTCPFFSDEVFRWLMWEDGGKEGGWKRGIKYSVKEYRELVERMGVVRERLGVGAVEMERVAWVLGREGVDGKKVGFSKVAEVKKGDKAGQKSKVEKKTSEVKKGVKRKKDEDVKVPVEGVRRSSRKKTAA